MIVGDIEFDKIDTAVNELKLIVDNIIAWEH